MAYLGRGIENLSDRVVLDALTASATASYTLQLNSVNFVPSSASSLTVSLNGVIQKPDSSYTVSGSTLTFSSALTSSDSIDFIIAERGITLQTPSAGSVNTDQLAATAVTPAKMDLSQDYTFTGKVSGHNYPGFCVTKANHQTISSGVTTAVVLDTEVLDSDNAFSSNAFTVPSGKGGKYLIGFQMAFRNSAVFYRIEFSVFKNSWEDQPTLKQNFATNIFESNFTNRIHTSVIRDLSAGDVLDLRAAMFAASGTLQIMSSSTLFYGYRIGD